MKSMHSFARLGADRSHSRSYGEAEPGRAQSLRTALARRGAGPQAQRGLQGLQRRMADECAISCERFGGTQYQVAEGESGVQGRICTGARQCPMPGLGAHIADANRLS